MNGGRRRRVGVGVVALGAVLFAALVVAGLLVLRDGGSNAPHVAAAPRPLASAPQRTTPAPVPTAPVTSTVSRHRARITVRVRTVSLRVTDPHRTMATPAGVAPRAFTTIIRYPVGRPGRAPLIVFGHGFAVTPEPYAPLLRAWARAGYIVAAPIFPLESRAAPGGPDERDLPNQPADMSLVIDRLLAADSPVGRAVDRRQIAVAGQSDGGDTALAAAFDPRVRDPRVRAAIILSGAFDPFISSFAMPENHVALLATQGTDDAINPPSLTDAFYGPAAPPKYLLELLGAGHLPPYTQPGPELTSVEHATLAFLGCYLERRCQALHAELRARRAGPGTVLTGRAS